MTFYCSCLFCHPLTLWVPMSSCFITRPRICIFLIFSIIVFLVYIVLFNKSLKSLRLAIDYEVSLIRIGLHQESPSDFWIVIYQTQHHLILSRPSETEHSTIERSVRRKLAGDPVCLFTSIKLFSFLSFYLYIFTHCI